MVLAVGSLAIAAGTFVIEWANPSPHGYIEFFVGLPLLGLGVLIVGGALAFGSGPVWLRALGWALLVGTAVFVLLVAVSF